MKTLKSCVVSGLIVLTAGQAIAGLQIPYATNANTLHLWHFDGASTNLNGTPNVLTPDEVINGGILLTNVGQPVPNTPPYNNIRLGQPSFSGLANALHVSNSISGANFALASGGTNQNGTYPFVNPDSGAFTMEAVIKMDLNPFGANGNWEIIAGDNQGLPGGRGWQFRIESSATVPFINLNSITAAVGTFGNFKAVLPNSGPDAAVAGQWYHVAVAYTGYNPTNGDAAGVLTYYWTLLDANRTFANAVTNFTIAGPGTLGGNPWIAVGGSGRTQSGLGNGEGFKGLLDEVRMSQACLRSNEMAFVSGGALNPPTFTQQPATNSLVGYGQTLSLFTLATGTFPISFQWQQNGGGGFTNVLDQTNNTLVVPNVTFAAGGSYRLIVTNNYGSKTSLVAQVAIGAAVSELFSTGLDTNGVALSVAAPGSVDPHYKLTQSADILNLGPNAIVWGDGFPTAVGGGLFAVNDSASCWVGPQQNAGQVVGTYTYKTSFVIDSADPATVTLPATVWLESSLPEVRLNGQPTGISVFSASPQKFANSFTITNGFVAGLNTLEFDVRLDFVDFTGFRAQLSALGQALPAGKPTIADQPADQTVRDAAFGAGDRATFSVVALGRPPLAYQWRDENGSITDATNRSLTFTDPATGAQGTNFSVVISNDSGSVTSSVALLTLLATNQPPVVANYSLVVYSNTSVAFNLNTAFQAATDADGDLLTLPAFDLASTNGATLVQNGVVLTYTPVADYLGADQFSYTINDGLENVLGFVNLTVIPLLTPNVNASKSGNNLVLSGSGGSPGGSFRVLSSTDLTVPLAGWTTTGTGAFDNSGNFNVANAIVSGEPQRFYLIQVP